jgi:hypothetical protein
MRNKYTTLVGKYRGHLGVKKDLDGMIILHCKVRTFNELNSFTAEDNGGCCGLRNEYVGSSEDVIFCDKLNEN